MSPFDAFDFGTQVVGSISDQINQGIGMAILGSEIPKRAEAIEGIRENYVNEAHGIWDDFSANTSQSAAELRDRYDPSDFAVAAGRVQGASERNTQRAFGVADQARADVDEVRTRIGASEQAFAMDREAALKDMKFTNVYDMESARGANDAFIQESVQKAAQTLQMQGLSDNPQAVMQMNESIKSSYRMQLQNTQKQINANYQKERQVLHSNFAALRNQLHETNTSALIESQKTATEAGMWSTSFAQQAAKDTFDAFRGASEGAAAVSTAVAALDQMAAGAQHRILQDSVNLELKTEELLTGATFAMADKFWNWDISVPQWDIQQKPDSGGDSGGFSFGAGVGPFSGSFST